MSSALQIQSPVQTLALGDVTLQIRQYRLRMECPIAKQMLCSGEPRWTLLGAVPCILTVRGKIAAENAASLLAALRTFFMQHTAFSFTFLDAAFADMQISAMDYQCDENGHLTEYSLTFIGQSTGGTA